MSREGPVPLSADLERFLEAIGIPQVSLLVGLHKAWPAIAGPLLAAKALPLRFRNGILTLAVRNHSWAQELRMATPALLGNIRRVLGPESPVTDLRFVVGPAEAAEQENRAPEPDATGFPPPGPDPDGLASVSDAETRESLRLIHRRARAGGGHSSP
ncbi:MAG TPA: DUF721 domain-containing protein [Candidatus Deferrimicrobiaceae bacterium]